MNGLEEKVGLIVGVANPRSLAYGIARAVHGAGGRFILTHQGERLAGRVRAIGEELDAAAVLALDFSVPGELERVVEEAQRSFGRLDFLVHAVAYAERDELEGRFLDTSRAGFGKALDVSVYSLVELTRACAPLLRKSADGASVLTLSYLGAERAVPNYNVMGVAKAALEASVRYLAADLGPERIRVNALSPGPIKTLSAAGIGGLRRMLEHVEATAPLRRNVTIEDVGATAAWLLGAGGAAITGEVLHVDCGYHALGAPGL